MRSDVPRCRGCNKPLDRIDHYGIEHTMLRGNEYGPVGIMDGSADGKQYGSAGETDLRCGYCGESIAREQRVYFYKRWANVKQAIASMGAKGGG